VTGGDAGAIESLSHIAPTAIVGNPFRPLLDGRHLEADGYPAIGDKVWVGHYTTIGSDAAIGAHSVLEDFVIVQPRAVIGTGVLVTTRSFIGIEARVGDNCVIRGHVGDHSRVGTGCRIAGDLIHRQLDPSIPWDDPGGVEPAPIVGDGAFIGWRAMIIGGVNIGPGAYVCAGALITQDVPSGHIAYNRNQVVPPYSWPGALGKSAFFTGPGRLEGGRARIGARLRRARRDRGTTR
jgi:acetyltransferase-like isoleucine patch superfamily enzyme